MQLRLRDGLSFCWIGDCVVFLDVEKDRYFCLSGEPAAALRALADGRGEADVEVGVRRLIQLGILQTATDHGTPIGAVQHCQPTRGLQDLASDANRPGLGRQIDVFLRIMRARRVIARSALRHTLARLSKRKLDGIAAARPNEDVAALAGAFNRARRGVLLAPRCLPDTLAVIEYLADHEVYPDLVFGVRLSPFGAHCWAQTSDIVLNDRLDRVLIHTPILRV